MLFAAGLILLTLPTTSTVRRQLKTYIILCVIYIVICITYIILTNQIETIGKTFLSKTVKKGLLSCKNLCSIALCGQVKTKA